MNIRYFLPAAIAGWTALVAGTLAGEAPATWALAGGKPAVWAPAAAVAAATPDACTPGAAAPGTVAQQMEVKQDSGIIEFLLDKQPLMLYRATGAPKKPYVLQLRTPSGLNVLRDAPADHKHHHGLMLALGVDGVDFWSEGDNCGRQVQRSLQTDSQSQSIADPTGKQTASFQFTLQQELAWLAAQDDQPLVVEQRQLLLTRSEDGNATLLCWQSRLEPPPGKQKAVLDGRHYFGLGMRFVASMDKDGVFFNAEGKEGEVVRGTEKLTPVRWMAYSASADGKPVTVAMFDHPHNPRHPAHMFTMTGGFAYMSATLNLWKERLEIPAGKPLVLRYGVALWDGKAEPRQIEALYQNWSKR